MPTINDATVVSGSGYITAGNGGRKLVRLDNGNLYSIIKKSTSYFIQKSTDGTNWSSFKTATYTTVQDFCLSTNGKYIYMAISFNNSSFGVIGFDESGNVVSSVSVDNVNQTALGNVSLAINEAKTELHAAWASKNSTYPSSYNIRYAKGTINADGTVTWGAVEQITNSNVSGYNYSNPTITIIDKKPSIICEYYNGTSYHLLNHSTVFTNRDFNTNAPSNWGNKIIIGPVGYAQSSPSAIYVPQSINGLANGRIWVTWQGRNSNAVNNYSLYIAYSDDAGVSWTSSLLAQGDGASNLQYQNPSLTANKNNELFIVMDYNNGSPVSVDVGEIKYSGGSWGSVSIVKDQTTTNLNNPSTLYDYSMNFTNPLFVYSDSSKVGFYGSWSTETISPTVGERGQILNRQNILTYNITSDSTIGTVTEKINGVVVGTKTLTSGQNTTVNITQAQWDAIPYGKYRNNSAGRNTIEIVTSNNTFTYTFEKWFDNTLDVISATKAVKDSKDYYLPSAKKILSDAINSKGGSTTPTDSIESMAESVTSGGSKRSAKGTIVSDTGTSTVTLFNGTTTTLPVVSFDFSALPFVPSKLIFELTDKSTVWYISFWSKNNIFENSLNHCNSTVNNSSNAAYRVPYSNGVVKIPVSNSAVSYNWFAYE